MPSISFFKPFCNCVQKLKFRTFSCPFHEMVSEFIVHFMKWIAKLTISQNGQMGYPFHEMVDFVVHFMKWTITKLGHNIYTVLQLFERNPDDRLGMKTCPAGPIRKHAFFSGTDWNKLESRKIDPPFKPKIVSTRLSVLFHCF